MIIAILARCSQQQASDESEKQIERESKLLECTEKKNVGDDDYHYLSDIFDVMADYVCVKLCTRANLSSQSGFHIVCVLFRLGNKSAFTQK